MNTDPSNLATLADSSSLLLGLGRPLSKLPSEPPPLPTMSPVAAAFLDANNSEVTRMQKNQAWWDSGWAFSSQRFASEQHPGPASIVCDGRPTDVIFGSSSRLDGRSPAILRK